MIFLPSNPRANKLAIQIHRNRPSRRLSSPAESDRIDLAMIEKRSRWFARVFLRMYEMRSNVILRTIHYLSSLLFSGRGVRYFRLLRVLISRADLFARGVHSNYANPVRLVHRI